MKPTQIINTGLQKRWLLIAAYEVSFDYYLLIKRKYDGLLTPFNNHQSGITHKMQNTLQGLLNQLQGISEKLRELDEAIHNYIKTHQQ